jgi:hypothetical protein
MRVLPSPARIVPKRRYPTITEFAERDADRLTSMDELWLVRKMNPFRSEKLPCGMGDNVATGGNAVVRLPGFGKNVDGTQAVFACRERNQ